MDEPMTIEKFNALLISENDNTRSLRALRQLTSIAKPEDIVALAEDGPTNWTDWNAV